MKLLMSLHGVVRVSSSLPLTPGGLSSFEAGRLGERRSEPWSGMRPDHAHQGSGDDDDAASWEEYHHPQPRERENIRRRNC